MRRPASPREAGRRNGGIQISYDYTFAKIQKKLFCSMGCCNLLSMFSNRYQLRIACRIPICGLLAMLLLRSSNLAAQQQKIEWSGQEKPIAVGIHGLRGLPDDV